MQRKYIGPVVLYYLYGVLRAIHVLCQSALSKVTSKLKVLLFLGKYVVRLDLFV